MGRDAFVELDPQGLGGGRRDGDVGCARIQDELLGKGPVDDGLDLDGVPLGVETDDDLLGLVLRLVEAGGQPVRPVGEPRRVGPRLQDLPGPRRVVLGQGELRPEQADLGIVGESPPGLSKATARCVAPSR